MVKSHFDTTSVKGRMKFYTTSGAQNSFQTKISAGSKSKYSESDQKHVKQQVIFVCGAFLRKENLCSPQSPLSLSWPGSAPVPPPSRTCPEHLTQKVPKEAS